MKDFIDELVELKEYKETLTKYAGIMSPFERVTYENRIKAKRDEIHDRAVNGALNTWNTAIENYRSKQNEYESAKKAEAARFDNVKLSAEIQAANTLVGMTINQPGNIFAGNNKADRIQAMYQDAVQSGDVNRQRAMMEVVSALPQKEFIPLARQAKNDLARLRTTDQIQTTDEAVRAAADDLMVNSRGIVAKTAEILGEPFSPIGTGSPLARALARVRPAENGRLEILEENDPAVTGIRMKG